MADRVRDRWVAGEVALNAWSTFGGRSAAGVLASAGFDAVTVDQQHGEQTMEALGDVVGAIERAGAVPFVRIGWNDPALAISPSITSSSASSSLNPSRPKTLIPFCSQGLWLALTTIPRSAWFCRVR